MKNNKILAILKGLNPFSLPIGRGDDAYGLAIIRGFLISSVIVIIFVSFIAGWKNFLHVAGLSLAVALASLISGGLLGFLFGIPRSKQVQKNTS
jgi:Na+/H+ antiporter NhaB